MQVSGTWASDRTHVLQFRAGFLKASPLTTLEGIERYLGSGLIRGIGPAYTRKLVHAFGENQLGALPVVCLTEVFRHAAERQVIVNAHRTNSGQIPELRKGEGSDFLFVDAADPEEGVRKLLAVAH